MLKKDYLMGTFVGDPLPGAPELASRGTADFGVRTIRLTEPDQPLVSAGTKDGRYPTADRTLTVEVWYPARVSEGQSNAVYTDHMEDRIWATLLLFPFRGGLSGTRSRIRKREPDR